jgi:hypothetical protein
MSKKERKQEKHALLLCLERYSLSLHAVASVLDQVYLVLLYDSFNQ